MSKHGAEYHLSAQDMRFTHLTALRDLTLRHEASSMQFAARPFSLTALPPSLRRLYLRLPSDSVRLFPCGNPRLGNVRPGVPAAPTEVLQVRRCTYILGMQFEVRHGMLWRMVWLLVQHRKHRWQPVLCFVGAASPTSLAAPLVELLRSKQQTTRIR